MKKGNAIEAQKEFVKGQKCVKTGLLKWSPDFAGATIHFDAAAKGFAQAGAFPQAIEAYEALANAYAQLNDMWAAGRAYESMADIALKSGTDSKSSAITYTRKAVEFFRVNGSADKAMNMNAEAARQFASLGDAETAMMFYDEAIKIVTEAELYMFGKDLIASYASLLIENRLYSRALKLYEEEITYGKALNRPHQINKAILCILATELVATQNLPQVQERSMELNAQYQGYLLSTESDVMTEVLSAWEAGDQEKYDKAVRRGALGVIEIPLQRALRQLHVPAPEVRVREELTSEVEDIISQNL